MSIKRFFKISGKSTYVFIKSIVYLVELTLALLIVGGGLFLWRLSEKPMNLESLLPEIESQLLPADSGMHLKADSILLRAEMKRSGILHVDVEGLQLLQKNGDLILDLPEVEVSYGIRHLLTLNYMPTNLTVRKALLHLIISPDGKLYIQEQDNLEEPIPEPTPDEEPAAVEPTPEPPALVIKDINHFVRYLLLFRRLALEDASVVIDNRQSDKKMSVPEFDFTLQRRPFGKFVISSVLGVKMQDDLMRLNLDATYRLRHRELDFKVGFDDVNLARFGRFVPAMTDMDLRLKGHVLGQMKLVRDRAQIRQAIQGLSFHVENVAPGSVGLPSPLQNTYSVKSVNLNGAVTPGLGSIHIDESDAVLTTGITADVRADITGLGEFLDTGDITKAKTVFYADVHNVQTEQVPDVWPSEQGPDAHAWVKKNLSGGELTRAEFTLYLTGGELVDLLGDIDINGVNVDYLNPMAPVEDVVGNVKLYPDKVLIAATSGHIGNLQLTSAKVDLTELKSPVSQAHIDIKATGPVAEALTLIDSKPLEFTQMFGIDPNVVSGTGDVSAVLDFPLIESLQAKQVKADVNAKITDGVFPLPINGFKAENGTFDLTVTNDGLKLMGTTTVQNLPLQVEWSEFFTETPENKIKSRYIVDGLFKSSQLVPLYGDIEGYITGELSAQADVQRTFTGETTIQAGADLTKATAELYPLSITKKAGVPAQLALLMALDKNGKPLTGDIMFKEEQTPILISGKLDLTNGWHLTIPQVRTPNNIFAGEIGVDTAGNIVLKAHGQAMDLVRLFEMPYFKNSKEAEAESFGEPSSSIPNIQVAPPNITVDVNVKELTLVEGKPLRNLELKGKRNGYFWQNMFVFVQAAQPFSINFVASKRTLHGTCNDLGDLLTRLGATERFFGGRMTIDGVQPATGGLKGEIRVKDFALKDPGFIIQAVTILGIVDGIRGKELHFKKASIPIEISPYQTVDISEGVAYGTSLGVTFKGRARVNQLNITGSVIPAYALNSLPGKIPLIGGLFKDGRGGGLIGVKYDLRGTLFNPVVTFNPLSSIAPGILGLLFQ